MKSQLPAALDDPTLEIVDENGTPVASNDDWKFSQQADIEATTLPPTNNAESAILLPTLPRGHFTAVMRGKNGGTGLGLVEVYNLGNQ